MANDWDGVDNPNMVMNEIFDENFIYCLTREAQMETDAGDYARIATQNADKLIKEYIDNLKNGKHQ